MIAFTPVGPGQRRGPAAARGTPTTSSTASSSTRAVRGEIDANVDGRIEPGERQARPARAGRLHRRQLLLPQPRHRPACACSSTIPLFDFLPTNTYRWALNPTAPPCPTTCTDFGSEVYPQGFRTVLRTAGRYRLPVYVTAERDSPTPTTTCAATHLLDHLRVLRGVMRDRRARVKGYLAGR